MAKLGAQAVVPTSINNTAGSASVTTAGLVTFTSVETISLNGVFSSLYDNYWIVMSTTGSVTTGSISLRLRAAGSDASGSNYTINTIQAFSTTVAVSSSTSTQAAIGIAGGASNGSHILILDPFSTRRSIIRCQGAGTAATDVDAVRQDANRHNVTSSYDGFTIFQTTAGRTHTGQIMVYGMVQ
jgi:hypothetical protein